MFPALFGRPPQFLSDADRQRLVRPDVPRESRDGGGVGIGGWRFQFNEGKPTAAVLHIEAWEAIVSLLEDLEDTELVKERLKNWPTKEGWTRWEDFAAELEADDLSTVD